MRNNAAYLPESPIVYIILPKSIRNRASFDIFDFSLTDEEMKSIAALNRHDTGTVDFGDPKLVKFLIETYG